MANLPTPTVTFLSLIGPTLTSSPRRQLLPCRRTPANLSSAACSNQPSILLIRRQARPTDCLPMVWTNTRWISHIVLPTHLHTKTAEKLFFEDLQTKLQVLCERRNLIYMVLFCGRRHCSNSNLSFPMQLGWCVCAECLVWMPFKN